MNATAALEELLSCNPQTTFSYVCPHVYQDVSMRLFYLGFRLTRTHSQLLESLMETCRNQISALVDHSAHPSTLHVWFRI